MNNIPKGVVFIKVNPIFEDILDVKKVANLAMKDIWDNNKRLARLQSVLRAVRIITY